MVSGEWSEISSRFSEEEYGIQEPGFIRNGTADKRRYTQINTDFIIRVVKISEENVSVIFTVVYVF